MATTKEQVLAVLNVEEPDYALVPALGEEAVPFLRQLVDGVDSLLASKAAYAAGLIGGMAAQDVLNRAAQHPSDIIRVAAAATLCHLPKAAASRVVATLLRDTDIGVIKQVLRCIRAHQLSEFKPWVQRLSSKSDDHPLEALAKEITSELPNP